MVRHHIGRHVLPQVGAELPRVGCGVPLRHQERDEAVDPSVAAQHDGCLGDPRHGTQPRLDLTEFDPEAADLHLVVDAAVEGDIAALGQADGIPGAVQDGVAAVSAERIGNELLGRQLRASEVSVRHAGAPDEELALHAWGAESAVLPDHVGRVVRKGAPYRDGLTRTQFRQGRDDGRFGGAVAVEQAPAGLSPAGQQGRRKRLAPENDQAQTRNVARQHGEQRRHRVDHGDTGLPEEIGQAHDIAHGGGRCHEQRRPDHEGDPDLLHG